MTQQFEDFVNAALDKSLASDVTLPTANKIPVYTGIGRQVTGKTPAELGLAVNSNLALKADLVDGVVPANQLPSYVDDVLEFANLASFPVTGESGKVYVAIDTKKTYRWSGSTYVQIGSDLALGETPSTAYRGDRGKTAYDHSQATGNPHGATTANINDSVDRRYVTDAKLTVLNNTSGTNSGDETQASVKTKLGAASSGVDGYLTGGDWNTFNGKQAALADVITSNTYGNSTQYPVITFNAKGIATGVTLQTVPTPTLTDATFSVQKNGSPSIAASWDLTALTSSAVHTYPNKAINFGDLPSVATTDINVLSGTRCRILGGSNNTVSGMDNIVIGGLSNAATGSRAVLINCTVVGATNNDVIALNARWPNAGGLEANSILLGTSRQADPFKNVGAAAALRLNALHTVSSAIPISGTLYATIDGSQTLSASNLVLGGNDTGACATHEVEFIVGVGVTNGSGGVLPAGYFIAKRRIVVFRHAPSGTFFVSAVQTIGTDITLGTLDGTITPDLSIDTTTGSATIHRLLCKIDRTGGVAGQEVVAMSVRVASHHSK